MGMKRTGYPADFINRIWRFFTSVRVSIFVFLLMAVTSIVGTLIPQNRNPEFYFRKYGDVFAGIFRFLDFIDMYHSWWFRLLMVLLTVNIVVCSLHRLPGVWKIVFEKDPSFNSAYFKRLPDKEEFEDRRMPDALLDIYKDYVFKWVGNGRVERTGSGFVIFGEKNRWTRFGVYFVHFSIVLLLLGALAGSIFGFNGVVNIPEGESVDRIWLRNRGKTMPLGFAVRCDDFEVSFYDSGTPKEYRSSLTVMENGKPVKKK